LDDILIKKIVEETVKAIHMTSPEGVVNVFESIRSLSSDKWSALKLKIRNYSFYDPEQPLKSSKMLNSVETKQKDIGVKKSNTKEKGEIIKIIAQKKGRIEQLKKLTLEKKRATLKPTKNMKKKESTKVAPKAKEKAKEKKSRFTLNPGILKCMRKTKMSREASSKNKSEKRDIVKGEIITITEQDNIDAKAEASNPNTKFITSEVHVNFQNGRLGMNLVELTNVDDSCLIMVESLVDGGQAMKLGILEGDIIVSCGGLRIPQNKTAYDQVVNCFKKMSRPIDVLLLREGNEKPKWPPVRLTFDLKKSDNLGMEVIEVGGDHCIISELTMDGEAAEVGLMHCDRLLSIGTKNVPIDNTACDIVENALANQTGPLQCVVERTRREVVVTLTKGSLGMSLVEVPPRCMVNEVKNGGQCDKAGIQPGDFFISIGGKHCPEGPSSLDVVLAYLQSLPRPLEVVLLREGAASY
jgi:hypothetical protein